MKKDITITLTPREAKVLNTILQWVGGDPSGRRGAADSVANQLHDLGIGYYSGKGITGNGICFKN